MPDVTLRFSVSRQWIKKHSSAGLSAHESETTTLFDSAGSLFGGYEEYNSLTKDGKDIATIIVETRDLIGDDEPQYYVYFYGTEKTFGPFHTATDSKRFAEKRFGAGLNSNYFR